MKILITSDWYSPMINGVVESVLNLKSELTSLGHDVRVLTLSNNYYSYVEGNVYYIGSISVGKIYPNARFKLASTSSIVHELAEWKPDIIHSQCEFSTFLVAKRIAHKTGAPIVHTYHTVYEDYTHYFSLNQKWGKAFVSSFSRATLRKVKTVIVPTDKVRKILQSYQVESEMAVIPTGINLSKYEHIIDDKEKEMLKEKHNISLNNNVLVYVGRLAKEKNLEEIISYFGNIDRKNVTLLIVGDGPHRQDLEEYAERSKRAEDIIFTGMVAPEKISKYYQLGDIFVTASNSETQGLTYVECLASGVVALCKRDECIDGVIIDGETGWQYDGFDDFKRHMLELLDNENLRTEMGKKGRELAFSHFSKKEFAKSVEKVYEQAILV